MIEIWVAHTWTKPAEFEELRLKGVSRGLVVYFRAPEELS